MEQLNVLIEYWVSVYRDEYLNTGVLVVGINHPLATVANAKYNYLGFYQFLLYQCAERSPFRDGNGDKYQQLSLKRCRSHFPRLTSFVSVWEPEGVNCMMEELRIGLP